MRAKIAKVVNSTAYMVFCAVLLAAGIIGTCAGRMVELLPVAPAAFILLMMPFVFEEV